MPSKDSMPKKKPVYSDKRKKKPTAQTPEGTVSIHCTAVPKPLLHDVVQYNCLFPFVLPETSELASPTSEVAEPLAMAMEEKEEKDEPGHFAHMVFLIGVRSQADLVRGQFGNSFPVCLCVQRLKRSLTGQT